MIFFLFAEGFTLDINDFINWGSLFGFLAGIFFGISMFALVYLYAVLKSFRKKRYLVSVQEGDIDGREVEMIIKETQEMFKNRNIRGEDGLFTHAYKLSRDMVIEIATKFYPNSKHPLLELSIDETLLLSQYVTERIEEILNHKGLKMARKLKISTIMSWSEIKEKIDDNVLMQTNKKYKLVKKFKSAMSAVNIVNPVYWAKKVVVKKSTDIIMKKICIISIGIVGEETYKIYSKRVFNEEMAIDSGVNQYISDLKGDLDREYEEARIDEIVEENERREKEQLEKGA